MFDITPIVYFILIILSAIITKILIPYIESKTSITQQNEINAWVELAVEAAEQIYRGSGRGAERKEYVLNWLKNNNITYDADTIDVMIEAAVYKMKKNGLITLESTNSTGVINIDKTKESNDSITNVVIKK